ncbi:MAG: ribonuclease D [Runella sp.]
MPNYHLIQTPESLEKATQEMQRYGTLAVDTEFDNNHYRYGFTLCMVQMATPDACFLIDTLAINNLKPLWELLEEAQIEKVFHDCGEDMRIFYLNSCTPKGIFDTSLAAKILGYEKLSLTNILFEVLYLAPTLDKQRSDWTQRPLTDSQLEYAAYDVIHLLTLRDTLAQKLQNQQLWGTFQQMMQQTEQKDYAPKPKTTFLSVAEQRSFSPFDAYILNELYRFRDQQAQQINRPPYQIIAPAVLHHVLQDASILNHWEKVKGVHHRLRSATAGQMLKDIYNAAVSKAEEAGLSRQKRIKRPSH